MGISNDTCREFQCRMGHWMAEETIQKLEQSFHAIMYPPANDVSCGACKAHGLGATSQLISELSVPRRRVARSMTIPAPYALECICHRLCVKWETTSIPLRGSVRSDVSRDCAYPIDLGASAPRRRVYPRVCFSAKRNHMPAGAEASMLHGTRIPQSR